MFRLQTRKIASEPKGRLRKLMTNNSTTSNGHWLVSWPGNRWQAAPSMRAWYWICKSTDWIMYSKPARKWPPAVSFTDSGEVSFCVNEDLENGPMVCFVAWWLIDGIIADKRLSFRHWTGLRNAFSSAISGLGLEQKGGTARVKIGTGKYFAKRAPK